jgi:hypothetical protein
MSGAILGRQENLGRRQTRQLSKRTSSKDERTGHRKKRERHLGLYTIRRLIMAVCVTAVGVIPMVKATESEANSPHIGKHYKKHYKLKKPGLNALASRKIRPWLQPSFEHGADDVCPGNPHGAYECKIWPPPVDVDPDRRNGDAGGG